MAAFWQSQMINALLICTFCQFGRAIQHEAVYILILEVTPRFTRISNSQIVIPAVKTPSCKWEISTDPNATDIILTDITIYFNCYTGSRREINVCDDYVRDDYVMMIRWLVPSFWPSCLLSVTSTTVITSLLLIRNDVLRTVSSVHPLLLFAIRFQRLVPDVLYSHHCVS